MSEELVGELPPDWSYTTLGEACRRGGGEIQTGPFGSQLHAADYVESGIPSIMPQNIGDNRIVEDGIARISEGDAVRLKRYLVRPGDIVYSRRGDVERRALVREQEQGWLCGTGCLRVRLGEGHFDPRYVAFYLGHKEVREWIVRHAHGATMPNLNTSILSACPLAEPPITQQHAIASILSALDDKIDLNRRMSATLEEMARALFRSWFVDFDPVRAKAEGRDPGLPADIASLFPDRFEESELGEIPAGWEVGQLSQLCSRIETGGTPSRRDAGAWEPGVFNWFKTSELHDGPLLESEEKISDLGLSSSAAKLWPKGTILFAIYASPTVGRLGILGVPGASNQAAAGLTAKDEFGTAFLHRLLVAERVRFQSIAVGAAQQNLSLGVLSAHLVNIPRANLAKSYSRIVAPLDARLLQLTRQSRTLAALRDSLLPKLISGELRVPEELLELASEAPAG